MKLPNDVERRKEIQEKLLQSILTDQLKLKKRDLLVKFSIILCEDKENEKRKELEIEVQKESIEYFHSLSAAVFDSFVCELGFEMKKEEMFDCVYFYYFNIYKWFVKDFISEKEVKNYIKTLEITFANTIIDQFEYEFPRFITVYLLTLNPKNENEKCKKIADIISFLAKYDGKIKALCQYDINKYIFETLPKKIEEYRRDNEKELLKDALEEFEIKKLIFFGDK